MLLEELQSVVSFAHTRGDDARKLVSYHYVFQGNAGTGKSTIARRMGLMYAALGLLEDATMHEVSASDFLTGFSGQAGKKTRDILSRCRGAVLFIDNAHQLSPARGGNYMTEVVDELVNNMTAPGFKGSTLVLLAGYTSELDAVFSFSHSLSSLFTNRICTEDLKAEDVAAMMAIKMQEKGLPLPESQRDKLLVLSDRLASAKHFRNGHDVDAWSSEAFKQVSASAIAANTKRAELSIQEAELALERVLSSRSTSVFGAGESVHPFVQDARMDLKDSMLRLRTAAIVVLVEDQGPESPMLNATSDHVETTRNHFQNIDKQVLLCLQDALTKLNFTTIDEVAPVSELPVSAGIVQELISALVSNRLADHETATSKVLEWQKAFRDMRREDLNKEETDADGVEKQAIWRCSVCGRGGMPWIVCSVAPYIERFEVVRKNS